MNILKRLVNMAPELLSTYALTVGSIVSIDVFADFLNLQWVQIFAVSGTVAGVLGRSPIFATLKKLAGDEAT